MGAAAAHVYGARGRLAQVGASSWEVQVATGARAVSGAQAHPAVAVRVAGQLLVGQAGRGMEPVAGIHVMRAGQQ